VSTDDCRNKLNKPAVQVFLSNSPRFPIEIDTEADRVPITLTEAKHLIAELTQIVVKAERKAA